MQRGVRAVFVTLAVALLTGVGIGFVSAADGSAEVPEVLAMAAPNNGEAGSFRAVATGLWSNPEVPVGEPFSVMDYVRASGPLAPDAFGRMVPSDLVVRASLGFYDFDSAEDSVRGWFADGGFDYFHPGTGELITIGTSANGSLSMSYSPLSPLPPQQMDLAYNMTYWGYDGVASCLLVNALQGREVPTSAGVAWGRCHLVGLLALDGTEVFHAASAHRIDGYETTRLSWNDEDVSVDFYVNPALPVPLRAVVEGKDGQVTLDLAGFTPGDLPRPAPAAAQPDLPITKAPRQAWGIDDEGSALPFKASAAWKQALADPLFQDLRDYLAAHPDAYTLAALNPGDMTSDQSTTRLWLFVVTDGPTALSLTVVQTVHQPPALGLPELAMTYQYAAELNDSTDLPTVDQIPWELPTMEGLEQRYATFAADGAPPVNSALVMIGDPSLAYGGFYGSIGSSEFDTSGMLAPDPASLPAIRYGSFDLDDRSLTVGQDGAAHNFVTWGMQSATTFNALGSPPGSLPPGDAERADSGKALLAAIWLSPASPEAARVGIVSLAVGALYWLWPTLKGSLVGLFSRLQPPTLLEHPARAQLLQIVQAEPGIHFQDLVRRSGLANGTAVHHLGKMTQVGLLSARPFGRYTCYFPGASPDRAALAAAPVLRSDGARRVYEAIQGRPGLSGLELAGLVALQPSTVSYHVQRLVDSGLVRAEREGRSVRLSAVVSS